MRCRIKGSKATCKVKSATAFVKSLTMIDKSKAMTDKSKAMMLVFQGESDFILGEKGEKPVLAGIQTGCNRERDGM